MIELWYINTQPVRQPVFQDLLVRLKEDLQKEIMKYRLFSDQKNKLFGRLMVMKYHQNISIDCRDFDRSPNGKPFIRNGIQFNISHSKNIVSVGFSDQVIGVDLEYTKDIDINPIISCLHPEEKKYIEQSSNRMKTFYNIWTRKEAYLKAKGVGVVDGLNNENCITDINYQGKCWKIQSLSVLSDYSLSICSLSQENGVQKRELTVEDFIKLPIENH